MGGAASTLLSGVPITSGSDTVPGSVVGENLHTLTAAQIPTIDASGSGSVLVETTVGVLIGASPETADLEGGPSPVNVLTGGGALEQVDSTGSASVTTASTNTGGGSHNTVDLSILVYWNLKL